MQRYIRESRADSVVEHHLAQKPRRNLSLLCLADDETVVEDSISDVADQWDERYTASAWRARRRGDDVDTQSKKVHPKRIPQMWKPLSR
jgi:hypothetical protein